MNKKLIPALIAVIMMAALLCTACGGGGAPATLAGTTWEHVYTAEELKNMYAPEGASATMTLTFTDNIMTQTVTSVYDGETHTSSEEDYYTYKDGKFSFNDGGDIFNGTVEGNTLTVEDRDLKIVFKKK